MTLILFPDYDSSCLYTCNAAYQKGDLEGETNIQVFLFIYFFNFLFIWCIRNFLSSKIKIEGI